MKNHIFQDRIGPNLPRYYSRAMMLVIACACLTVPAFAVQDLFAVAKTIMWRGESIFSFPAGMKKW